MERDYGCSILIVVVGRLKAVIDTGCRHEDLLALVRVTSGTLLSGITVMARPKSHIYQFISGCFYPVVGLRVFTVPDFFAG